MSSKAASRYGEHSRSRSIESKREEKHKHKDKKRRSQSPKSRHRSSSRDTKTETKHKKSKKKKKKKHRSSSSSSSNSDEEELKLLQRLEAERLRLKEQKKKQKELLKANETPEEKRARRLKEKQEKERKRRERMGWDNEYQCYTNQDNPFGDSALTHTFVWTKKLAKEGVKTVSHDELEALNRQKQLENKIELEKVKQRRLEREAERAAREAEAAAAARAREAAQFSSWARQEDAFHLQQARLRSQIRIRDARAKPIDLLAWYVSSEQCVDALEMHEPYTYLNGLQAQDLEDLLEDIKVYKELERETQASYWEDVQTIVEDELAKLRRLAAPAARRDGVHRAVAGDVAQIFKGKTGPQLEEMRGQIEQKISGRHDGVDVGYWESLLSQLKAHMARARLRERHQENLRRKLQLLKREQGVQPASEVPSHRSVHPGGSLRERHQENLRRKLQLLKREQGVQPASEVPSHRSVHPGGSLRERHQENLRRKLQLLKREQGVQPASEVPSHRSVHPGGSLRERHQENLRRKLQLLKREQGVQPASEVPSHRSVHPGGSLRERHQENLRRKLQLLKRKQGVQRACEAPSHRSVHPGSSLREPHQENLRRKLQLLKREQGVQPASEVPSHRPASPEPEREAKREEDAESSQSSQSEDEAASAAAYASGRYSPELLAPAALDPGTLLLEPEHDLQRLAFLRARLRPAPAAPGGAPAPAPAPPAELEAQRLMGAEPGARFSVEHALPEQPCLWADKYRPRKPRYFNRVHTGFEWNKYNQTHYDMDNPPPKIVQGYKFNIFYPDLIDKSATPEFSLKPCADNPEFAVLRFHAGPPYEDIAFKIVSREWEYSYKRGFRCHFHNNIFQLWFHFKRYRYRR